MNVESRNSRYGKYSRRNESQKKLKNATAGQPAYRNHLSCWRSTPCARCSRTKSEKSAARLLVNSSVSATKEVTSVSATRVAVLKTSYVVTPPPVPPSTANGF